MSRIFAAFVTLLRNSVFAFVSLADVAKGEMRRSLPRVRFVLVAGLPHCDLCDLAVNRFSVLLGPVR
jgi:hypothetical protein